MDSQKQDTTEYLKNLILKLESYSYNLTDEVKKRLDDLLKSDVEIQQPSTVKGVKKLLCAIHTYKV